MVSGRPKKGFTYLARLAKLSTLLFAAVLLVGTAMADSPAMAQNKKTEKAKNPNKGQPKLNPISKGNQSVPEPFMVVGTAAAIGIGSLLRKEYQKNSQQSGQNS